MRPGTRKEKASQILELMEQLDLDSLIRAELYDEWSKASPEHWVVIHGKLDVTDTVFKILRRIANG